MMHVASRDVVLVVALTTGASLFGVPAPVHASPPTNAEWVDYQSEIRDAEMRGDFAAAEGVSRELLAHCRAALPDTHPDVTVAATAVREYHKLQSIDGQTKRRFMAATTSRLAAWQRVRFRAKESLPMADSITELIATFHDCSRDIPLGIPREAPLQADCDGGIARILAVARVFDVAEPFMSNAHQSYARVEGLELQTKGIELMLSEILRELHKEPDKQVALLKANIDFAERHRTTARLEWWQVRAMTLLAETYYRLGNGNEADHLIAEVRSRLPERSEHHMVGWCKSWCDRHEARQLMEKGNWDGAYEKILQARVGTIDYGRSNLCKGLTMERILRMSAEIQRKRGNHKEADEDQEYADLIARHAAKLRTAVEAELKKLNESEANPTPQPLPAP